LDYSASKGAVISFTRALSGNIASKGKELTGLHPDRFGRRFSFHICPQIKIPYFGSDTPMERAGQPVKAAPCYVFLASDDSSYMSGQVLHPNGGEIVNG